MYKKQQLRVNRILSIVLGFVLISVGIIGYSTSVSEYYIGQHNVDLSWNSMSWAYDIDMALVRSKSNIRLVEFDTIFDRMNNGENITYTNAYRLGLNQMNEAFYAAQISVIAFMSGLFIVFAETYSLGRDDKHG